MEYKIWKTSAEPTTQKPPQDDRWKFFLNKKRQREKDKGRSPTPKNRRNSTKCPPRWELGKADKPSQKRSDELG